MLNTIADRLDAVRAEMSKQELDAFIVPRADEYLGEYIPSRNERLRWISGFTGSAGVVIVLKDSAAIFVDGRYTVQVQTQIDGNLFERLSLIENPPIAWLCEKLNTQSRIGFDARLHNTQWYEDSTKTVLETQMSLIAVKGNPIDLHWSNRPEYSTIPYRLFSNESAGKSSYEKRQQIGETLSAAKTDVAVIASLDSICWLLNIRGSEVPCFPVILGTGLIEANGNMQVFVDLKKLPEGTSEHVGQGVIFRDLPELSGALDDLTGKTVRIDKVSVNAWIARKVEKSAGKIVYGYDPVALPKAQKNTEELKGITSCHVRDGLAVTRFMAWLDGEVKTGCFHDERLLSEKLESFRALEDTYLEPSFDTISAAAGNAAMCHYNHNNATPASLTNNSLYLVDSGGQYLDGTTDVTRTIAIGTVTVEQKKMSTLVLKGHIALDQTRFPAGTTGNQLDTIARHALWQQGYDYDHGTGHGVGHCLSVHEGPQRIGKNLNMVALLPGMVLSNEPGYYKAGKFGIRWENLMVVQACGSLAHAEQPMLEFRALTMIPIDRRLIDKHILTTSEIDWVNNYHQLVYKSLSPSLNEEEVFWLKQMTAEL